MGEPFAIAFVVLFFAKYRKLSFAAPARVGIGVPLVNAEPFVVCNTRSRSSLVHHYSLRFPPALTRRRTDAC